MQIKLAFDVQSLVRRAQQGRELVFGIAWEHDGEYYPSEGWTDFGEVVLGWWFGATLRLVAGGDEDTYQFMDGPYSVAARYERKTGVAELRPQGTESIWRVPFVDLCREFIRAANRVDNEVAQAGLADRGRPPFRATARRLEEELAKSNP